MASLGLPDPDALSLEAQVAQLIVVRASGFLFDHQRRYPQWELNNAKLQHCTQSLGIGGVILLGGSAVEVGVRSQQLQSWAEIPLLLAADIEEGAGQRFAGATHFPPPMALSQVARHDVSLACQYAEQMGSATAQEAIAIGLNWILAPVVDVNNNVDNPVINVRAFGDTVAIVTQLSQAFIRGAHQFSILTTAKHFPGHGDTTVDSHLHLPVIAHHRSRLDQIELAPFRAAVESGVDAVMTAHIQVPTLDSKWPATLSPSILTQLLRQEMKFNGLVVTDALIMGAIAHQYGPYDAAVLALEAGADVLLMPADPEGTIQAICEAVRTGRLSAKRIAASVERIWRAKQKANHRLSIPPETCHAWEHTPPPPVQLEALASQTTRQVLTSVIQASTLTRGNIPAQNDPKDRVENRRAIVIVDSVLGTDWLNPTAPAIALPMQQGWTVRLLDNQVCSVGLDGLNTSNEPTLLQIFSRGNPFRGKAGLSQWTVECFQTLVTQGHLIGLVVYGSPYVFEFLLKALPVNTAYGFTYAQTPEAQNIVLSRLLTSTEMPARNQTFTD
ncbi:glycoside hydrolase family 3 N-terminal domain-containing protein [Oscillatoria sp. CS-180]|uniref:glycoside hydrolase family 3 N-terminal domain-containing protein n=1 Tax=Oscillatoria sp. CS-180 TaxID=3021720 RepID=UPI00232E26CE|nr:glycoside hydrolase family 3 N-terminal domain-containing protein [Oscillatoria sp. CS-180]MDB9528468.1 glycoside hydrolase family 3 N-terminal domain-containing protein [Oscillatoria sp. CS-180]